MADTHGFEVVIEAAPAVLRKALRGAWKSAECGDTTTGDGRIPEYLPIQPGIDLGGFTTESGQVELPQDQLDAELLPAIDGARLTLGLVIQVVLADPPVPSAKLLDLAATARVDVPVGVLPGTKNVGIRFDGLPRSAVRATVTSGDPVAAKVDQLLAEYVHLAYENGGPGGPVHPGVPAIPHEQDQNGRVLSFFVGSYTVDSHLEIYDDQIDPAHAIVMSRPDPGHVLFSIPVYLRVFNIVPGGFAPPLADPMGVETRLDLTVALETVPGTYTLRFDTATVAVGVINPAPGVEGTNYTANNGNLFGLLENALRTQLVQEGTELVRGFGTQAVDVPSVPDIETVIANLMHADLAARGFIGLWTPEASGEVFEARDVTTRVFADLFAITLNAGDGADIGALTTFIPADREFAIALAGPVVQQSIEDARATNGWADADLPRRITQDDKDADVRELDVLLVDGAIRMTGEITVIDAILGSIDVDADFRADVGLHWTPDGALNADGVQQMENHLIGDPDVDPEGSVAFWIIAIILAIITWGAGSILIAIIIIVIAAVVTAIASNIGSSMAVDPITGAVQGITGWPPELARIGRVRTVFHDPITIATDGLVIAGTMDVLSSCESTQVLAARSGGSYTGSAQASLTLAAAATSPMAGYSWRPGDGTPAASGQNRTHVYVSSGVYVAEHSLTINQPGGATSRHFALVQVANVQPTVDAGPDITVDEGQVVTLVGRFSDVEYPDAHETTWNFGDHQPTQRGTIAETNNPPRAEGTTTVQHAWCDNGVYAVTLRVRDQNGGMAVDTRTVTVRNVPPVVDAGPDMYIYPCTVLTLTARFTDPGWCDLHTATWDFGDCTTPIPAVVTETNAPPAGRGTAVVSHTYRTCGTFVARCTVVDDDGAAGTDDLVVRMVDMVNGHFEDGFARRGVGDVANGWQPYASPPADDSHAAANFVVHSGRRSQGMRVGAGRRVGVYQRIGANPEWAYQLTAWYDQDEAHPATARLGVDPTGGDDPAGPDVLWSQGGVADRWTPLTVRVVARATAVTVFLEAAGAGSTQPEPGRAGEVWFDDVDLLAVQPFCPPAPEPPRPREVCLDFGDRDPGTEFPPTWSENGFWITSIDGASRAVGTLGPPAGGTALVLGAGITIEPPSPADRVTATLVNLGGQAVELTALDAAGGRLDSASVPPTRTPVTVVLTGPGIVAVRIDSRAAEGMLIRICALLPATDREGRDG
jgi:PKD repeat protein